MPADTQSSSGNPASKPKAGAAATGKKELKILMLHGMKKPHLILTLP